MIPAPELSAMVAFVGLLRLMKEDSVGSYSTSPLTSSVMVLEVSPGTKTSVPEVAW
jgi:hypothetical protein